jgi:tetratricopeptide (TPR) repeat protein
MGNNDFLTFGKKLYYNGDYEGSLNALNEAIKLNPNDYTSWYYMGLVLSKLNKKDEALNAFNEAITINPKYAKAFLAKGNLYDKSEEYKKSIECFNKAIKLNKNYYSAYCNKAIAYNKLKKYKKALNCLNKAIKIDSKKVDAWYIKGAILIDIKKYDEALKCFNNFLELNKNNYKIYYKKIALLYILGKYDEAIKILLNIIKLDEIDDIFSYVVLGNIYFDTENIDQALNTVEKIFENYEINNLEKDDNYYYALVLKGKIKIEEKDYDGAIDSFKNAIQLNIGEESLLVRLAYSKYLKIEFQSDKNEVEYKNEIESIIRLLEKSYIMSERKKNDKIMPYILYFLGSFYLKNNNIISAKESLEQCLKQNPNKHIKNLTCELLNYIRNYRIKPYWLLWWIKSPVKTNRIIFWTTISTFFSAILIHPFLYNIFPNIQVNWTIYIIFLLFLIFILISPNISNLKAKDIELNISIPPPFEPNFSPIEIEKLLNEYENDFLNV